MLRNPRSDQIEWLFGPDRNERSDGPGVRTKRMPTDKKFASLDGAKTNFLGMDSEGVDR